MNRIHVNPLNLLVILLGCTLLLAGLTGVFQLPVKPKSSTLAGIPPSGKTSDIQQSSPLVTRTPFLPVYPTAIPTTSAELPESITTQPAAPEGEAADPAPEPAVPTRIQIPAIELDAPVVPVIYFLTDIDGITYKQYQSLNYFAAGWHSDSAMVGASGNTVINGHNNAYGEVFAKLADVQVGDSIDIDSASGTFHYTVVNRIIFPDSYYMEFDKRLSNGRWVARSSDNRLTLVTCWPYETYTHRLILVAKQVGIN